MLGKRRADDVGGRGARTGRLGGETRQYQRHVAPAGHGRPARGRHGGSKEARVVGNDSITDLAASHNAACGAMIYLRRLSGITANRRILDTLSALIKTLVNYTDWNN